MSEQNPDGVPEYYTPEELNRLVQRLGKAGWLDGNQVVTSESFKIRYSKKGSAGMRAVVKIFEAEAPSLLYLKPGGTKPEIGGDFVLKFGLKMFQAVPELVVQLMGWSPGEGWAFIGLVYLYNQDYGQGTELPPSREIKPPGVPPRL